MSDADCTPGREPRSVAASSTHVMSVSAYMQYNIRYTTNARLNADRWRDGARGWESDLRSSARGVDSYD